MHKPAISPTTSYSQFGEDRIVVEFFGAEHRGFFVEVGANDGVSGSNTYLLEQLGWKGILVEPSDRLAQQCRQSRPDSIVVHAAAVASDSTSSIDLYEYSQNTQGERFDAASSVGNPSAYNDAILSSGAQRSCTQVPARTLDRILHDHAPHPPIDFVSIDVEGFELSVLQGFSLDLHKPTIVLLEDNSFGVDTSISEHMSRFGYQKRFRTFVNDWYVRSDAKEFPFTAQHSVARYLSFKLLASRLKFPLERVDRVIEEMLACEPTGTRWWKRTCYRYCPIWLLSAAYSLIQFFRSLGRR